MPTIPIEQVSGIDNLNPPFNVPLNALLEGENVYIDDERRVKRRAGYVLQAAGSFHSLWNNHARDITLVVQGDKLQEIQAGFGVVDLVSGLQGTGTMSYIEASQDTIVYSNGVDVGRLVNLVNIPFVVPTELYKKPPVAGHLLAWLNGRLYIASSGTLWFADAYTYSIHKSTGFFQFKGHITLLQAVEDGLYVGDQKGTYFIKNDPPSKEEVHRYAAIPYSAQVSHSELLGLEDFPRGKVVFWSTEQGVVVGGNGGVVLNLTRDHYKMPSVGRGGGIVFESNGNYTYVVNLFN
jgi:hypothetical protein